MNKCIIITGANGYIGNAVVQRFLNKNYKVVFVDNFLKKKLINEMKSFSAIPQISFDNKMKIFQKDNNFFNYNFNIVNQIEELDKCIKLHHPDIILNLAHIPSGPYSQISRDNANLTLTNNIIGTNNILWSIKENCPDCRFICIGTTGEYDHYSNIDIEEGYFQIKHKGRLSKEMIYPRRPSSVYHACYDDKTEVLTDNGWKLFKKLSYDDKVATLNKKENSLEYYKPLNIMEYDFNDELISIKTKKLDLMITPNHNIFEHSNYNSKLKNWRLTEAKSLYGKGCYMRRNVKNWVGNNIEHFVLPSCKVKTSANIFKIEEEKFILIENWIRFLGWFITEGSLYKSRILISQQKEYNFEEIIKCFNDLNLNKKVQINRSHEKIQGFSIHCVQLANYLKQFGKSHERFIPKNIKNLPKKYLKILFDVMMKGNGWVNNTSKKYLGTYYTKSKQLADDVQEIAFKCGYATVFKKVDRIEHKYQIFISDNDTVQLILSKKVKECRKNKDIYKKVKYDGKVYCCEVPNNIIYVRRNGKSIWSGNSKTASTYLIDFLCRTWNLRCTDIQQSVVFGAYTDEIDKSKVYSEFHSDEAFGTVLNRFIVQSVLDVPLTIYGEGKHQRGFLSLNDSIQAIELLVDNETDDYGKVRSINQLSSWCSMNNVANMVKSVGKKFNLNIKSSHISTPRNEYTGDHYYKYITKNLTDLGYVPTRTIKQEIEYVFKLLLPLKEKLLPLKEIMIPKIKWGK